MQESLLTKFKQSKASFISLGVSICLNVILIQTLNLDIWKTILGSLKNDIFDYQDILDSLKKDMSTNLDKV